MGRAGGLLRLVMSALNGKGRGAAPTGNECLKWRGSGLPILVTITCKGAGTIVKYKI